MAASDHKAALSLIRHPFYQDADGINRPPGPDKHRCYGEFAAQGAGVVPIIRTVRGERLDAFLICRFDDVRAVLRDQETFSRAAALSADPIDLTGTILAMDGAEHARVRGIVKHAFTRSAVARLRPVLERGAASEIAAMKGPQADLVGDFALPFALRTICDLLGVPPQDQMQFRKWGDMFLGTSGITREEAARSAEEMGAYLAGQLAHRHEHPADDLLTRIATDGADQPLDVQVKLALALIVGGWETVASAIARFVFVLCTRPYGGHATAWEYLLAHPSELDPAVTELERLYSPSTGDNMPRQAMTDVRLPSGARLSAGDIVIPSHDAANLDPRVFAHPERLDLDRTPNPHLSFGYGAHYCVGAHLGALEVRVALAVLLRERPGLRLAVPADDVRWTPAHSVTTPEELPVEW